MRWILPILALPGVLHAEEDHSATDEHDAPLVIETSDQLRDLAEIDGNPDTFTEDERMKFTILGQLLGIDADLPMPE